MNKLASVPVAMPQAIKFRPFGAFRGFLKQLLKNFAARAQDNNSRSGCKVAHIV
jgi:hypothetical protein